MIQNLKNFQIQIYRCVYHNASFGPTFPDDIVIYADFKKEKSWSSFPNSYKDIFGKGKSIFSNNNNEGENKFDIIEIEVFTVLNEK